MLNLLFSILLITSAVDAFIPSLYHKNGKHADSSSVESDESGDVPPDHKDYAKMARYMVHKAEWTAMGTLSTYPSLKGFPMVNVIAVADSVRGGKSTGNLYFYLTNLDFTAQDLKKENKLTVLLSMDQDLYCTKNGIDPMEPTCARIMISGSALQLAANSTEFDFGTQAMQSRHPASVRWLNTHNFFLCKLDIQEICVLDYYGGPHFVTKEEYYNASLDTDYIGNVLDTYRLVLQNGNKD